MNCHGHDDNNENNKKSSMKHMLLMVLCCGLPILIALAIPFLKIGGGFKVALGSIVPFLCPIMMLLMIPMMLGHSKEKENYHKNSDETKI